MLDASVNSRGLDISLVERDSSTGMWSLSRLGVTLEQEQSMRQKQDYYLNYGRALRVIREDIPRYVVRNSLNILGFQVSYVPIRELGCGCFKQNICQRC